MYTTAEIINVLFDKFDFKSYLEIGIGDPNNVFNLIKASLKHGIDPSGKGTHKMTSDEFFTNYVGKQKYDVIFVDGFHSAHQAYRDAINSINHLNEGGFIIMHDCNPPIEQYAVEFKDYKGGFWNGTVYKAFIQLKYDYKEWSVFTVDNDWGYGVLTPRKIIENKVLPYDTNNSSWENFDKNRKELLQLISIEQYKNI